MFSTASVHSSKVLLQVIALFLCLFTLVSVFLVGSTTTAYCLDGEDESTEQVNETIEGAFNQVTQKAYEIIRAVIVPCCIVALAIGGFQFLFGGNQGAEKARKIVIGAIAAICFVVFAPIAVNTVAGYVADSGNSDWNSYNPLD